MFSKKVSIICAMSQVVRQQSAKLFRLVRFQYGTYVVVLAELVLHEIANLRSTNYGCTGSSPVHGAVLFV